MHTSPETLPASSAANQPKPGHARFPLGKLAATPGALDLLDRYQVNLFDLLGRHARGDWGDVCPEDARANDQAHIHGGRLLSSYTVAPGNPESRLWLLSEQDRSATTAIMPSEY